MRVIRNINNNVAICQDDGGHELVAIGKGIGFRKPPYEISLDAIDQTYYNLDPHQMSLLDELPDGLLELGMYITKKGSSYLGFTIKPSFVFALCDHLNFAIENTRKGLVLSNPMSNEIRHMYEKEYKLGQWALKAVERQMKIKLPSSEAGNIALHFINARQNTTASQKKSEMERFIDDITDIVESELNIIVDRNGFNYSRFVTHLKYLLKRSGTINVESSENAKIYAEVYAQYPNLQSAVEKIKTYITNELQIEPSREELLYLMLHLNRLCSREGL